MARRKTGLGSPAKDHAFLAVNRAESARQSLKHAKTGSCTLRFSSLEAAISSIGKAWAHAFDSGGKVHKGALTKRTVSEGAAKLIYAVDREVTVESGKFMRDCLKRGDSGVSGLAGARRRRRR
jgi:hypothetical protein